MDYPHENQDGIFENDRVNTSESLDKDGENSVLDILKMFGGQSAGPSNIKVDRKAPHSHRGYIATFCVDPSEDGVLSFYDELREVAGGGVYRIQLCGVHGRGQFGPAQTITLSGRPIHYEPRKRRHENAPVAPIGATPVYIPQPTPSPNSAQMSDMMMGLLRDLIERQSRGETLSREDLIEAFRSASPAIQNVPVVRDSLGEMRNVWETYREMKEIFSGGDDHTPPRGEPGWIDAVKTIGPLVLQGFTMLSNAVKQQQQAPQGWYMQGQPMQQYPPQPGPNVQQGPVMGSPTPPQAQQPTQNRPPEPTPSSPRPEPTQGTETPADDEDDGDDDEEYIDGPLTSEEIEAHFAEAGDEEKMQIVAKLLPHMGVPLSAEEIRALLSSQAKAATATEPVKNGVLTEH